MPVSPPIPYHEISRIKAPPGIDATAVEPPIELVSRASDPATLRNGMLWYNSTLGALRARVAGLTFSLLEGEWEVTDLDASAITTGVFENARLPGGRFLEVANEAARLALASPADVVIGDVVKHVGEKFLLHLEITNPDVAGNTNDMGFNISGQIFYLDTANDGPGPQIQYFEDATAAERREAVRAFLADWFNGIFDVTTVGDYVRIEALEANSDHSYDAGNTDFGGGVQSAGFAGDGKIFTLADASQIASNAGWGDVASANAALAAAEAAQTTADTALGTAANAQYEAENAQTTADAANAESYAIRAVANGGTGVTTLTGLAKGNGASPFGSVTTQAQLVTEVPDLFVDHTFALLDEDFIGGSNGDGLAGTNGLRYNAISGTNSITYVAGTVNNPGQLQLGCGAVSGNAGSLSFSGSSLPVFVVGTNPFEARFTFKLNQTTATKFRIGLANDQLSIAPGRGEYLRYDTSLGDTHFMYVVKDGGAETAVSTGIAADTNWHTVRIRTITATSYIYGFSINTSGGAFGAETQMTNTNAVGGITRYVVAIIGNDAVAVAKSFIWDAVKMRFKCTR